MPFTRNYKLILCFLAGVSLTGCAKDELQAACISDAPTFDIEEVSTLEDSMGFPNTHDAIIISHDKSNLPVDGSWRVSSVDVLLMIPSSEFDYYPNNVELTIEIFGGTDPRFAPTWRVKQTVDTSKLEWIDVRLNDPHHAYEIGQRKAWWTFDFTSVIPESGMRSTNFIVGAVWENDSLPTIGYSNYNRPCDRNWSKYDEREGWMLNSDRNYDYGYDFGDICSWPMLRVHVEERIIAEDCLK